MIYRNSIMVQNRIDWLYDNWKGQIPIEQVFDPYNDTQLWYPISGFNGYEISDHGNVRSMKNFRRFQFGTLCRHKKGIYELSTDNNERVNISIDELWELSLKYMKTFGINGYPRATCTPYIESRNKRMFIDFEKVSKNNKRVKKKPKPIRKEGTFFPKFSVIPEREIKCPIIFYDK